MIPGHIDRLWSDRHLVHSVGFTVGVLFLQPTEFAKIIAIIVLARYFEYDSAPTA
jgi:hypothetical protein